MDLVQALLWSHEALNDLQVPHALIGGMALSEYGYGRGTEDVDWIIPEEFVETVIRHFMANGFNLFFRSQDILQLGGKAEIDFVIARRPISRGMIEDANYSDSLKLPVIQIEDLMGLKIQAYSNNPRRKLRDLADLQELIERNESINWIKVKFYADQFGEWATIEGLKK